MGPYWLQSDKIVQENGEGIVISEQHLGIRREDVCLTAQEVEGVMSWLDRWFVERLHKHTKRVR